MFRSTEKVRNVTVSATDGLLGKIDQFLFDSRSWAVRYIVAEIGPLLAKEKKLLSPAAFESFGPEGLRVNLTMDQIRKSPDIDTDQPVSRQQEQEMHTFYSWPYYWEYPSDTNTIGMPLYPGFGVYPYSSPLYADRNYNQNANRTQKREGGPDRELRSTKSVNGYVVSARGRNIGNVIDFLLDDELWVIRYTIIETGAFLSSNRYILASHWAQSIAWQTKEIYFDIVPMIIEQGPQYDTGMLISREYETRLFDYYRKPYYWKNQEE